MISLLEHIESGKKQRKKMVAVLIDPDKCPDEKVIDKILEECSFSNIDFIFFGGSLITEKSGVSIGEIKKKTKIPVIIFPGHSSQVDRDADGILLLSLISGRNPDLLIGQHVQSAIALKSSCLQIIPTGYILIESGNITTAIYMSQSLPIPANKPEIAATTALAGEQLGLKVIYLDGGSGASSPPTSEMIKRVSSLVSVPVIAGGGVTSIKDANILWEAGADIVVLGTVIEKDPSVLKEFKTR